MPPPAKPISNKSLQRPLHQSQSGQPSSPFFSQATRNGATKIAAVAGRERESESGDEASALSFSQEQAMPANKRQDKDSREENNVRLESKKPAKSSAKQNVPGDHKTLSPLESSQTTQRQSSDLDYEERKLHDRVSREEATIFRSAKSYGQSVEKRRRLAE